MNISAGSAVLPTPREVSWTSAAMTKVPWWSTSSNPPTTPASSPSWISSYPSGKPAAKNLTDCPCATRTAGIDFHESNI